MSRDGRRLAVRDAGALLATVDTRTFAAREPGEPGEPAGRETKPESADKPAGTDRSGFPWVILIIAAGVAGLAVLLSARRAS
jgi:hypothetical protein